ncbi:MAG: transporter substrate-binding domain-containing protein [Treponemataceae bacterium]
MTKKGPRRLPAALVILFTQFVFLAPTLIFAQQNPNPNRPITVVCDDNYPPYSFRSAAGVIQGIIPDQWREWSLVTGREIEFKPMKWEDCLAAMEGGRADVLDSFFKTPDREKIYDFLEPYATLNVPVFFHHSISGIAKPEDLRGFRIAAKKGDAAVAELKQYGSIDVVEYPDYESIIRAAKQGEIRVFCVDEPPALYYLYKYNLDSSFRSALSLYRGKFHRAVKKNRKLLADGSDLYSVLRTGFDSIPQSTYRKIDRRWFGAALNPKIDPALIAWIGGVLALIISGLVAFATMLRKQVARKTRELSIKAEALEASERKNLAFIKALPDLFIIMDGEFRYYECKTANPELLAKQETELIGKKINEVGFPSNVEALFESAVGKALSQATVVVCEYELEVIAGKRYFEARLVKMAEDRALVIIRDITAKADAERKMQASLKEKEILLKEVHHRVKNNMQVVSSLIQLQAGALKYEEDRILLKETQQRIKTMAQIHELLYRSDDLSSIDAADYIGNIVEDLQISYLEVSGAVQMILELEPVECSMDVAVPLGLIVNEVVSNSFKYASGAPGGTIISVSLKTETAGETHLILADNGPGLPLDWEKRANATLGLTLVQLLASQLNGTLSISGSKGTRIELIFSER